jgi:broad specificity phosphatase PhoE
MKTLLLVRHGESIWNASRRLQGQADMPLSDLGIAQAQALAPLIGQMAPDHVICSDLGRAQQTAQLLGYPAARPDPMLREISVGDWTGLPIAAIDQAAYRGWRAGQHTPRNGESWADFRARTLAAVTAAHIEAAENVLMVCHGGVIRALLDGLIGLSPDRLVPVGPASLTVLAFRGGAAKLAAMNITASTPLLDAPD